MPRNPLAELIFAHAQPHGDDSLGYARGEQTKRPVLQVLGRYAEQAHGDILVARDLVLHLCCRQDGSVIQGIPANAYVATDHQPSAPTLQIGAQPLVE